jgi:SAM-dependent methyltransferase
MSLGVWFARLPRAWARRLYPALRYANLMRAIELYHLGRWVKEVKGWQVLDVGCGHGLYSLDFARRGARLVGCDLSLPALKTSYQTGQALGLDGRTAYLAADGSALPLPGDRFDLVFCNCVLEHILDDRQALLEMYRTLRPGGLLYLTVDNADHRLTFRFLERLGPKLKRVLLRPEVATAPTVGRGLDEFLAAIYYVRRQYRREDLEADLRRLGFEILDRRAYLTLLGAAHYEAFYLPRGLDPRHGLGRWLHMITSLLSYPLVVLVDGLQRQRGYGLMFMARKRNAAGGAEPAAGVKR